MTTATFFNRQAMPAQRAPRTAIAAPVVPAFINVDTQVKHDDNKSSALSKGIILKV